MKTILKTTILFFLLFGISACKLTGKKGSNGETVKSTQSIISYGGATLKEVSSFILSPKDKPWVPSGIWKGEKRKRLSLKGCEEDDELFFQATGRFLNKVNDKCGKERDDHGWWKMFKKGKSFFLKYSYNNKTFKFKVKKLTSKKLTLLKIRGKRKIPIRKFVKKKDRKKETKKLARKFITRPRKVLYTFEFER